MARYLKLDEVASELALTLGSNCKKRRAELGMSQAELAERSGVAASHLSHMEQGNANPTLDVLQQLAEELQTTVLRSEEQTSELTTLIRISYAVFCLKKTKPHLRTTRASDRQ